MNNMAVGVAGGMQGSGVQGINHVGPGVQSNMANPQGHHLHGVLSNEDERKVTLMNYTLQFSITNIFMKKNCPISFQSIIF